MPSSLLFFLPIVAILAGASALLYFYRKRPFLDSLDLQILSIKIQRKDEKEPGNKDFLKDINLSEQLFNSLSSIQKPIAFELAVHNSGEEIHFYVAVPRAQKDFAKRQIQGLFLDAQVEDAPEYTVFNPTCETTAAYLTFAENDILPLRTYREAEADTFATILSTLSKLRENGDGASIQILFRPAGDGPKKVITADIEQLKKGLKLSDIQDARRIRLKDFKNALAPKVDDPNKPKVVDEEAVKALNQKGSKPLYFVNIRIVTSSDLANRSEEILLSIAGAFSQFSAALRNSFKVVKPSNLKNFIFKYVFREFDGENYVLMNSEELASIFHVPTLSSDVPRVSWLKTKEVPPPANLPAEGVVIGENIFRGDKKLVKMTDADRRRHLYIIGQTGVGKSYRMITPMVVQDIAAGRGVCVIDPHGDLVDGILERIPKERIDDVIVFDPGDLRRPLSLNMLEYNLAKPEEKSFIVNELLSIFDKLYDLKTTGGPMFEYYLRNALLLMLGDAANEPATLLDVPRIFSDAEYRNAKLARCTDPLVVDFWTKEAAKATGEQGLQNMTVYIVSKFATFISNDYMRPIIGQEESSFNFRDVMDNQKILLVKLAKGKIGDMNASLLGMIITGRILMSALARGDMPSAERKDFYFYIDEFQNFTTDSISVILSEARKYGLCLTVAHQFIAQLKDNIRESIFGNVGSMVSFRVGAPDTEFLLKQFGPEFSAQDLTSIENNNAFAKLLINGEPARPFTFTCSMPPAGYPELRPKLEELSRLTYGRDLAEIEAEIIGRLRKQAREPQTIA